MPLCNVCIVIRFVSETPVSRNEKLAEPFNSQKKVFAMHTNKYTVSAMHLSTLVLAQSTLF